MPVVILSVVLFFSVTLAIIVVGLVFHPARKCPVCGYKQPRLRKPADLQEALGGGGTCPQCSTKLDRRGEIRKDRSN